MVRVFDSQPKVLSSAVCRVNSKHAPCCPAVPVLTTMSLSPRPEPRPSRQPGNFLKLHIIYSDHTPSDVNGKCSKNYKSLECTHVCLCVDML